MNSSHAEAGFDKQPNVLYNENIGREGVDRRLREPWFASYLLRRLSLCLCWRSMRRSARSLRARRLLRLRTSSGTL